MCSIKPPWMTPDPDPHQLTQPPNTSTRSSFRPRRTTPKQSSTTQNWPTRIQELAPKI